MPFRTTDQPGTPGSLKLGPRSLLVLMKLGHDLREQYEMVRGDSLPDEVAQVLQRLEQGDRRVGTRGRL